MPPRKLSRCSQFCQIAEGFPISLEGQDEYSTSSPLTKSNFSQICSGNKLQQKPLLLVIPDLILLMFPLFLFFLLSPPRWQHISGIGATKQVATNLIRPFFITLARMAMRNKAFSDHFRNMWKHKPIFIFLLSILNAPHRTIDVSKSHLSFYPTS